MDNVERKIEKWETVKKELLSIIPKEYKIDVQGLEDDNIYFHPFIKIDDDIIIKGQADINNNDKVYGWDLQVKQELGCFIHTISFDFNNIDQINRVLTNWNKYKDKIKQYLEMGKMINENINILQEIKNNIQSNLLNDMFTQEDRKECLSKLFKVKEWIENERIIENYSGIN